ncbi:hypothetical protein FAI40_09285 [Acetobacteraceae bacterium]|nr:hypothetical protein FAI40_09285 [Acetobacteraceae bacterium]
MSEQCQNNVSLNEIMMKNLSTLDGSAIQVEKIWEKLWRALCSEGRSWLRSKNDWDAGKFEYEAYDDDYWSEERFCPRVWLDHDGEPIAEFYFDDLEQRSADWKEGGVYFPLTRYTGNEGEFGISFDFVPEDDSTNWKVKLEEWMETEEFNQVEELGFRFFPEHKIFFFPLFLIEKKLQKI